MWIVKANRTTALNVSDATDIYVNKKTLMINAQNREIKLGTYDNVAQANEAFGNVLYQVNEKYEVIKVPTRREIECNLKKGGGQINGRN